MLAERVVAVRDGDALVAGERPKRSLRILDLGCGTGLSGAAFKDLAAKLHGVDLSPAMIEKSRAREIYDRLSEDDVVGAVATAAEVTKDANSRAAARLPNNVVVRRVVFMISPSDR